MANLTESPIYEPGIFQLEKTTPPLGGAPAFNGSNPSAGHANVQGLQLANRTAYLKQQLDLVPINISLNSYDELRAYTGSATSLRISGSLISGVFNRVSVESPVDNGITRIVDGLGRAWDRDYVGAIFVGWAGSRGDGTDESFSIQNAIDVAASISESNQTSDKQSVTTTVLFDSGKVYLGAVTLKKGVCVDLSGSTLKLPDNVNSTVIEGENYLTLTGTNSGNGVWHYGVRNGTLDGNKLNNSTPIANKGHGLAVYGRSFLVENLKVINTYRRGITLEYGTGAVGTSPFDGKLHKVSTDNTGEEGIYCDVSDMHVDDVNIRSPGQNQTNTYDGIIANKGIRGTNINVWRGGDTSITHRYSANISDGCTIYGAHLETAGSANLRITGNRSKVAGVLSYNLLGSTHALVSGSGNSLKFSSHNGGLVGENLDAVAVRLGDSAAATYCDIEFAGIGVRGGVVDFVNSFGANTVRGALFLNSDLDPLVLGVPYITDDIAITGTGTGSVNKSYKKLPARNGAITGVGNTQATGVLLTSVVNRAFANNSSVNSFILPKATGGNCVYVANISAVSIQIFPSPGDSILGLAANAPDTLPVGASRQYISHSTTQYAGY